MKIIGRGWDLADFEERILPVIDRMMIDRGWIVNCYAQLEFLLADTIVKCRKFPEYAASSTRPLPFGFDRRVSTFRKLCEFGPLKPHGDRLLPLVDRLAQLEDTRHFFTHGFMSVHLSPDGQKIAMHLRRYAPPLKRGQASKAEILIGPREMADSRTIWVIFAQTAVQTFREVYEQLE